LLQQIRITDVIHIAIGATGKIALLQEGLWMPWVMCATVDHVRFANHCCEMPTSKLSFQH
jgi:hypothetical protein